MQLAAQPAPGYERALIERALFPTMLSLILETLTSGGWEIRKDVPTLLGRSVRACFRQLDPLTATMLAKKLADEAKAILDAANENDVVLLWQATAHMTLRMAMRGHAIDPDAMLICTAIEYEWAEEDGSHQLIRMDQLADAMENEARRRGWWGRVLAVPAGDGRTRSIGLEEVKLRRL